MVILNFFIAFLAAGLPALVWLWFFLKEDLHPEPKKIILYVFCFGGLISIPTLFIQILFQNLVLKFALSGLLLIIGLALAEELFKFFAAYLAIHKNPIFDEPVDAMIYMIVAALGFATIENFFIVGNNLDFSNGFTILPALSALSLRFVGATLLHALCSAIVGYYWARGLLANLLRKFLVIGLLVASILHALFNYLILQFQESSLVYPSIFLIGLAFFVLIDFEKLKSIQTKNNNQN